MEKRPLSGTSLIWHFASFRHTTSRSASRVLFYGLGTPQKLNNAHWGLLLSITDLFSNHIYKFNILRTGIITNNQAGQTVFVQHNLVLTLEVVERRTNCQRPSMTKDTRNGPLLHRLSLSIAHSRRYAHVN